MVTGTSRASLRSGWPGMQVCKPHGPRILSQELRQLSGRGKTRPLVTSCHAAENDSVLISRPV